MKTTIHIKDFFPTFISTREPIKNFSHSLNFVAKDKYVFDFAEISFISRSAADELIKQLESFHIQWEFENTNANIDSIFKAVIIFQENPKKDFDAVAVIMFSDANELNAFLAAI